MIFSKTIFFKKELENEINLKDKLKICKFCKILL